MWDNCSQQVGPPPGWLTTDEADDEDDDDGYNNDDDHDYNNDVDDDDRLDNYGVANDEMVKPSTGIKQWPDFWVQTRTKVGIVAEPFVFHYFILYFRPFL